MLLHNRVSQAELKKQLYAETEPRITVSFYKYFFIEDPLLFRNDLYKNLHALNVFGRIYIASEGINAQVSIPDNNFQTFKDYISSIEELNSIRLNLSSNPSSSITASFSPPLTSSSRQVSEEIEGTRGDGKSFWVLKIKIRKKIVADGINDPSFNMANKGKYVNAETFNELTNQPGTVVIDMRNHYEYEVGHFENALEIPSDTFREQLPLAAEMLKEDKDKKIIMYCTGGIRCEKASAYMHHHGFKNVFHLEGGIINYANEVKEKELPNKFHGKNFVFDNRLSERITEEIIAHCHQCGQLADTHTNCHNQACHLLFIQCEKCKEIFSGCCSQVCADIIKLPEDKQKQLRKGIDKGNMVFNKSRQRLPLKNVKKE